MKNVFNSWDLRIWIIFQVLLFHRKRIQLSTVFQDSWILDAYKITSELDILYHVLDNVLHLVCKMQCIAFLSLSKLIMHEQNKLKSYLW